MKCSMEDAGKQNKMAVMPMGRLVISMALPMMVSLLVQSLYNIVDGIFVSRISEDALTATSLAFPVQILMIAVSVGTCVGINALLSQKIGAKEYDAASQVATTGMLLAIASALVFVLLGAFCTGFIVRQFGADAGIAQQCESYLRICLLFCGGMFVEMVTQRLLQAAGNTLLSMISMLVGTLVNVILDPIMIFGLFGCPAMGVTGAAVATIIGQWSGAAAALWLNYAKNPEVHFAFRGYRPDRRTIAAIYRVGIPTIIMQAVNSAMLFAFNAILMPISATAVAFFGVYYKLQNFLFMPISGLGQAAIPIAGFNYGAKNGRRLVQMLKTMLPIAIGFALAAMLIFLLFPAQLLRLFEASGDMLNMGVPAMRIISVTFFCLAVTTVLGYIASGLGNGVINMLGTAIRQFILLIPLAYLFARLGGVDRIWYSIWISELAAVLYSVFSFRRQFRKKVYPLLEEQNAPRRGNE